MHRRLESLKGWLLLLCGLAATPGLSVAHEADPSRFNYWEDIRPILLNHCGGCHRSGGVAPMSLLEFQEAVPWANAVKMQVLERTMPPWLPADGQLPIENARGLSAEEIDTIVDWAVGGTPEGERPAPAGESGSQIPEKDPAELSLGLRLQALSPVTLGEDDYEKEACVVFPTGLAESRHASHFALEPGLPGLVRRATIYAGNSCDEDAQPIGTWLPGLPGASNGGGLSVDLAPASDLAVAIFYRKGWGDEGKRLVDESALRIHFAERPTPEVQSLHVDSSRYFVSKSMDLIAIYPDPKDPSDPEPLRIEAIRTNGQTIPVLIIEQYNPEWREKYVLREPLHLPEGSELRLSQPAAWFDFVEGSASGPE